MSATLDILLKLQNIDTAQRDIKKFAQSTSSSVSKIESSFSSIKVFAAVAAAGTAVAAFFSKSIAAAEEYEVAVRKLEFALKSTGSFSAGAVQGFEDFAQALQDTTGAADDAVISQLAFAKQLGLTDRQAKTLVQTANDLSAVTGDSLETSADKLIKTYSGATGELGKFFPELKKLTKESLAQGAAIDILSGKVRGAAADYTNTFAGSLKLAGAAFNDILKNTGLFVTKNVFVINGIKATADAFRDISTIIEKVGKSFNGFSNAAAKFFKGFSAAQGASSVEGLNKDLKDVEKQQQRNISAQRELASTEIGAANIQSDQALTVKTQAEAILPQQQLNLLQSAVTGLSQGSAGAASAIGSLAGFAIDTFLPGLGGIANQVFQLFAAGPEAVSGFVSGFINSIPTIISNIILSLPALVEALINGLIELPQKLADSLSDSLPEVISKLAAQAPFIAIRLGIALQAQAPFIAQRFAVSFVKDGIPAIVKGFIDEFKKQVTSLGGILGGGGGGIGGVVGKVGKVFGFADGGTPNFSGGDNLLAGFNAKELVVDKTDTQRLSKFLDAQESAQGLGARSPGAAQGGGARVTNVTVPLVFNGKELASAIFQLNQDGFRTA